MRRKIYAFLAIFATHLTLNNAHASGCAFLPEEYITKRVSDIDEYIPVDQKKVFLSALMRSEDHIIRSNAVNAVANLFFRSKERHIEPRAYATETLIWFLTNHHIPANDLFIDASREIIFQFAERFTPTQILNKIASIDPHIRSKIVSQSLFYLFSPEITHENFLAYFTRIESLTFDHEAFTKLSRQVASMAVPYHLPFEVKIERFSIIHRMQETITESHIEFIQLFLRAHHVSEKFTSTHLLNILEFTDHHLIPLTESFSLKGPEERISDLETVEVIF
jgi:hypothetical protein